MARSVFPTAPLRRRKFGAGSIYVATIWLDEKDKQGLDAIRSLEREVHPGGHECDDTVLLSSFISRRIEDRLETLRILVRTKRARQLEENCIGAWESEGGMPAREVA